MPNLDTTEQGTILGQVDGKDNRAGNVNAGNAMEMQNDANPGMPLGGPPHTIIGDAPVVVFIGPSGCGKSMVLMSLVEYIRRKTDYSVAPDMNYNAVDPQYVNNCNDFSGILNQTAGLGLNVPKPVLPGTLNEILVNVYSAATGNKLRLLEAPGEHFFEVNDPGRGMANYLNTIISNGHRAHPVYYVMLLDLYTTYGNLPLINNAALRLLYEQRLVYIYRNGFSKSRGDRIILLHNKFDKNMFPGTGKRGMNRLLNDFYGDIKKEFNHKFLFWDIPDYNMLPYVSGRNFTNVENNNGDVIGQTYTADDAVMGYAEMLWRALTDRF